jgi:hypothetical protein
MPVQQAGKLKLSAIVVNLAEEEYKLDVFIVKEAVIPRLRRWMTVDVLQNRNQVQLANAIQPPAPHTTG